MLGSFQEELVKIETEYHARTPDFLQERIAEHGSKFVIFGAGAVGYSVAATVSGLQERLVAFCDNFKTGYNEQFKIPIISPKQLLADYSKAQIIVAVNYLHSDSIYTQVINMGFQPKNVFRLYSGYEIYDLKWLKSHYNGYEWAYRFFQDDLSRQIVLDRLRNYLYPFEMKCSPPEDQYFEKDVIQFTDHEVFVDGGFYTGDTALEFIKRMNGCYDAIYGFEPEERNYKKAKANLIQHQHVYIVNQGLWDKDERLRFLSGGSSSKVDCNGTDSISLTSLDYFFADKKKLPTFIKMDIEGAEKKALLGAEHIIRTVHPKLAICVYHKPEDIYELPQLIRGFYDGYRFALRHYSKGVVETVLYAV